MLMLVDEEFVQVCFVLVLVVCVGWCMIVVGDVEIVIVMLGICDGMMFDCVVIDGCDDIVLFISELCV